MNLCLFHSNIDFLLSDISTHIFLLFSIHFLWYWQGEFVQQYKHLSCDSARKKMVNIQPHWPCGCSIFHSSNALSNRQWPNYQPCFFSWYNIKLLVTAVKNLVSCVSPLLTLLGTPGWWDERKYWEPVGQPATKCVVISKETSRSLVFFVCLLT